MTSLTDRSHLDHQNNNSSNLDARIALHRRFSTNPYSFYHWYLDHLDLPAHARILEIGAGSGALWQEVAERIPPGWQITLTDLSIGMLTHAQRNLAHIRLFTFVQADAQEIPFPHEAFDAVLANHMLYHVPDRPRALTGFQRVLKPGGHLYAATNGPGHLKELRDLLAMYTEQMPMAGGIEFGLDDGGSSLRRTSSISSCIAIRMPSTSPKPSPSRPTSARCRTTGQSPPRNERRWIGASTR